MGCAYGYCTYTSRARYTFHMVYGQWKIWQEARTKFETIARKVKGRGPLSTLFRLVVVTPCDLFPRCQVSELKIQ